MEKENCGCGCMGRKKEIEIQGIKAQKPAEEAVPQERPADASKNEQK
jgi:translation initiation factor 1 (eIF-1/SUI1)